MDDRDLAASLALYRGALDAEMRSALDRGDLPLYRMLRYHLGWVAEDGQPVEASGGKALRPAVCFLTCEAAGTDWQVCLPAAAALELIHGFSLIHDDIQDGDLERRHRPTVWAVWGKNQGINAGDAMHVVAALAMLRMSERGIPAEKVLVASRLLHEACLRMIEGQYLDLAQEDRLDTTIDEYYDMVGKKTGALLECSAHLGAFFGSEDPAIVDGLRLYGRWIGRAFQVRDDVLGIWGSADVLGKSTETDIRRKKKSLPVVYAFSQATGDDRTELHRIYRLAELSDADVASVLGILDRTSARAYADRETAAAHEQALAAVESLAIGPAARRRLQELATFLGGREY